MQQSGPASPPRLAVYMYVAAAILLLLPSAFYWANEPFLLTPNEFDFFIGMGRYWPWLTRDQWFWVGKIASAMLLGTVGVSFAWIALRHRAWVESLPFRSLGIAAIGLGVLFACALPWISPDVFYYIGGGWVDVHYDADIYVRSFREIVSPRTDPILINIAPGFWGSKGNYGPLHHAIAASLASFSGGSPQLALLAWKVVNLAVVFSTGTAIAAVARRIGANPQFAFFAYACNPLVLFSLVTETHNDALQNLLIVLTILACAGQRPALSGLGLGAAVAYKLIGLILLPLVVLYWWLARKETRWRDALSCLLSATSFAAAAFLMLPSSISYCYHLISDTSWLPPRASIQFLAALVDGVEIFPPIKPILRKTIPILFLLGCATIAIRALLRRAAIRPSELARQMFMIFALWLLTTPTVTEWYLTWIVALGFVQRDGRIERGIIVLSACYLVPVLFLIRSPIELQIAANCLLFALLAYILIRQLWRPLGTASPAITSCPAQAQP